MKKKIPTESLSTRDKYLKKFKSLQALVREKMKKIPDPANRATALALVGVEGRSERPLWSDVRLRWQAANEFVTAMLAYYASNPDLHFYMVTFIDDCGLTSDRSPVVRLRLIEEKTRRAINSMQASGVCVIEVHPIMNYPGEGEGRTLATHVHVIIWFRTPPDIPAITAQLNASRAWNCSLGADPVHLQPINSAEQMERVCFYLWKVPHSAKNLMPNRAKPGRNRLMDTTTGYRGEFAVRVLEGLSQVNLTDVMFGVGDGTKVRQAVRSKIEAWHRARPHGDTFLEADFDIWRFWLELRRDFGSKNYLPYRFDSVATPALAPVSPKAAPRTTSPTRRPAPKRSTHLRKLPSPTPCSSMRKAPLAKRRRSGNRNSKT